MKDQVFARTIMALKQDVRVEQNSGPVGNKSCGDEVSNPNITNGWVRSKSFKLFHVIFKSKYFREIFSNALFCK